MPSAHNNGHKIKQLHMLTDQCLGQTLNQLELTPTQSRILGYLVRNRERQLCPRDVEEFFSLTHPTVSGILSRLEDKGFLTFRLDQRDRRCKRISVTPKALVSQAQIEVTIDAVEAQLIQGFTQEERACFARLLDRAIRNLGGEPCHFPKKEESHV